MANQKIEYNGELVTIHAIAKKFGIIDVTLRRYYEQTGNIYQAIEKCQQIQNQRTEALIEYNGEKLTISAIAEKIGIVHGTLRKYYEQTGNIYQAIEKCQQIQKQRTEALIEYNGEKLYLHQIATIVGISYTTLKKYYDETGNIYTAIAEYQTSKDQREESLIEYNGEKLPLYVIAKRNQIATSTLKRYYDETGNIYTAIAEYQRSKEQREESLIEYNGEKLPLHVIAEREGISDSALKKYYAQTGNIDAAIAQFRKNQKERQENLIEYNGKKLFLTHIAKLEGIAYNTLKKYYDQTHDIHISVKKCKEINQSTEESLIEYNGKRLSLNAIAQRVGTSYETLKRYYDQTGDINIAIKEFRKSQKQRQESLIEYNGKRLSLKQIAQQEEIPLSSLKKIYNKTQNIYTAVQAYRERQQQRQKKLIEYSGEMLTLTAIAKKQGITPSTLKKYYDQTGDIDTAIAEFRKSKKQRQESLIEYKGERLALYVIAEREGMSDTTLKKYYDQTGDIDTAIAEFRKNQGLIEYKGAKLALHVIAKREGVSDKALKKYYDQTCNIHKAVFMCRIKQTKKKKVHMSKGEVNLYDLSIVLGIKYSQLVNLLNQGMSIEQIKEQYASQETKARQIKQKREYKLLTNGQTLLEYCVSNGLNYSFIYRAINTYGKTLEEAVREYNNKGSKMPKTWIFEKYGLLLRHLFTSMKVSIDAVVDYMREEYISMDEALEKYIVGRNAKQSNLDPDWMQEVYEFLEAYGFLKDRNNSEQYDEFKRMFYIDETEEGCIGKSSDEIQGLQRRLLLFDIAEVIEQEVFSKEEMPQLLQMYEITPEEIDTIFLDLYSKFKDGILLGENEPQMKRRQVLSDIVRKWYFLGEDERVQILSQHQVTDKEQQQIEELSNQIVNHRVMLHIPVSKQTPIVE